MQVHWVEAVTWQFSEESVAHSVTGKISINDENLIIKFYARDQESEMFQFQLANIKKIEYNFDHDQPGIKFYQTQVLDTLEFDELFEFYMPQHSFDDLIKHLGSIAILSPVENTKNSFTLKNTYEDVNENRKIFNSHLESRKCQKKNSVIKAMVNALSVAGSMADKIFNPNNDESFDFLNEFQSRSDYHPDLIISHTQREIYDPVNLNQYNEMIDMSTDEKNVFNIKKNAFFGGCSMDCRGLYWKHFLNLDQIEDSEIIFKKIEDQLSLITKQQIQNNTQLKCAFSLIEKDYVRTDRNYEFYAGSENILKIKKLLQMHCLYNFDSIYAQGMNDIMAILLYVYSKCEQTASKAELYTFFSFQVMINRYLFEIFNEKTRKIQVIFSYIGYLLYAIDYPLFHHLNDLNNEWYNFCLSWVILLFKRVYSKYDHTMRLWDSIFCNYHIQDDTKLRTPNCQNILTVICVVLIKMMRMDIFRQSSGSVDIAVKTFMSRYDDNAYSETDSRFVLQPRRIMEKVADIYDAVYKCGEENATYILLFDCKED